MSVTLANQVADVGAELRRWRTHRALSQLALASRADVSTRHLSFIETGRSRPTPDMILRLAEELQVPFAEQNRLLLSGGYAPRYESRATDSEQLAPVMAGLRQLLDAHTPFPALLLDDHWNVVDANEAVDTLFSGCAPELLEPPLNVIRLALDDRGLAPRIRNFDTWSAHLLHQLHQRVLFTRGDPMLEQLYAEYAGPGHQRISRPTGDPVLTLEITLNSTELRLFSIASRIESAADLTLDGLHLETFLPADDQTRQVFDNLS
ncbi:transcriptional regulator with XRE-family HTH domain [Microbacterium ginsengiterrae]|uniref:Transcriptional regulator with XRE-family HTH domain n=1 Tax=Microbacterium ginsengiterrae TaxID=546115 RepID=A0A7W9CA88_9MICO|nr:helix-turn-helix transcriptional regulator [Microbacterium ginsengiterrae]MBB5741924.1 transcriptional regulator with XRE-family HTH domain [Microbacterium ginsengiterrae]